MTEKQTNILCVVDKKNTLDKLQQLFADEDWNCRFVSSGQQALDLIADEEIDLLVTSIELPEMDGVELLSEVSKRHPEIVRIALSGAAKEKYTLAAMTAGYAQQIIAKDRIEQELKEIIRSALRQIAQQKTHSQKFQALINSIPLLPSLPENYAQAQSCINGDEVDIEKMADIISLDVAMTSAILRWANSALFGQRFRVDTIKKAIIVLGTDIVTSLILSEAVAKVMTGSTPQTDRFDLNKFKCHSIATAILSRLLIKSLYVADTDLQDRTFIAGLLHDIGKLIAISHFQKKFIAASRLAERQNSSLYKAELEFLGTSHAELGSFLAEWWALPPYLVSAIASHHNPQASLVEPDIANAVYLGNQLSYRFGYGCNGEKLEREIDQEIQQRFFLTEEGLEILHTETDSIMSALVPQDGHQR